ncbi:uncharacterized protein LOC110695656 isoform X9 [Chenopodium quinoa]|uniref:uncharacterized protein LOC110695656 isoform X9 n=1 Tax=Chenopodium quinoa TaxID=63459 RepID=UPI000B78AB16|nr:uncharacterized protein LOC110695656 isoform X9 [Chenopodium quinoa]
MTSEADIPESLNMQARDEEDIDKTDKQCILNTDNHPKEHATIENVLQAHYKQTTGTNDEEERKTNITVGNGSSEYTEGESFMYPPTVEKVAYEDTVRQSKDFTEAILDDAITTISKTKIQQDSKKLATAEDADELPTGRPGLDEKGRETSDSMKIANQEPKSGHHNEEKESDIKTDNDAYNENQDKLNLHEIKTVELPVCVFEQLEGLKIDLKSEDLEKTFTEAVKGPRTMTQKDEEEKVDSTGLADISVLHTFSSPTDSNKESISETIKDMKELGVSSWENINTVGEKKGVNEVGNNNNLEEVEDTSRSNIMLTEITDAEGENFESNTNSHRDKIHPDEGDQNEQDTFISETDSGNSVKGPPESAMEIPEKCTVEAAMRQEGLETEILEEVLKLSSEYIEAGETTDDVTYSEHGETKSDIVSSEDQRNENHTVGAGNCHASKISQDNEDDLLFSNNTEAIDRGDEKKNLYTESQQEQENQKIELSKEESFPKDQASEVNKTKEFTHSEVNSDEDMKKNGADFTTSVTKEEMMQEFMESDPEKRLEVQNEKESTEAKTKGQASDNHLQERKIASAGDAEEETICKYDSTSVNISPEQSAERTDQSSFEVKEAEISREKKQCIDLDDFQSKNPTTEQDQNGSTLLEEYTYDVIMQDSTDRSMDDSFPKEKLQNQISDENHSEKAETNQEIIENSPRQDEVTEILNDSMKFIEADATIDKQHENLEDEDIYNLIKSVLTEKDIKAELGIIEVQMDKNTYAQICSDEIHEEKTVAKKEIVNQSSKESNSCSEKQGQEIAEACTQVLRNDEWKRIACEDIQVNEVEEEAAIDKQKCSKETEDQTTNGDSTDMVDGVDFKQENENLISMVEDMNQVTNAESDNLNVLEDKLHEQTGYNPDHKTEVDNNVEYVNQSSGEGNSCNEKQDQQKAKASTPHIEAEFAISRKGECTRVSSEEVQVIEIEEEAAIDKQPFTSKTHTIPEVGEEILLANANSKSALEDLNQDKNAQLSSTEIEKDEKENEDNCFSEIHQTKAVNSKEILNQSFEESNSWTETQDKEIAQASTPPPGAEIIQVSEIEKETSIGAIEQQIIENENSMYTLKDVDQVRFQNMSTRSIIIEAQTDEQTGSNENNVMGEANNGNTVIQISEVSDHCGGNQDQEVSQGFTHLTKVENLVLSNEEFTSISSEGIQVSEVSEEATIDEQQCMLEITNREKSGVFSYEAKGVEGLLEKENSVSIMEDVIQDKSAVSDNIEVLQAENTDVQTGTKDIHDTILVNNEEVTDKSSDEKGSYCEKNIQETNDACALQVEVIHHAPTKDECTRICSEEFQVSEVEDKSTIDKNKCSSETDDPNKTKEGVYSHKDMNSQSNDIQKDEKTNEQIFSDEIHETEGFSNQETVNQSFEENNSYSGKKDQKSSPTSTLLLETTDPTSSDDEWTRPPGEEVKVDEVEEEAVIVEQRCNAENGDPNKIKNVVLPIEVGRVEIIQDNENHHNIVEDVDQKGTFQDTDTEADSIEAQRNEKAHKETSLYEIQDTKVVNQKETVNQSSEENTCGEKQDQGTAEASEIRRKDECTRINGEEIQVSDVKEEVADEKLERSFETKNVNKITNGICPSEVKGLEIEQENESSMNIEQDLDKGAVQGKILQPESHEVQQVDQTHMKTCLNNFDETEAVRQHVEIEDQSSKESDFCNDKQDQEIARASKPNIEAEYPVIDKSTMISSSKVEEEETIEIQQCNSEDPNDIKHDVSSYERIEEDNVIESELNQPVGTETSGQNGNIKKDGLDLSQSAKKSNDHTQLIEYNTAAGLESEHHKHENEDPREMTNRFEEEVKHTYESISTNEIDTVSEKVKYVELGASIAGEVSSVQYVLAPEFGISRESIDKEGKQGVDTIKTKGLLERNNMKALEVSSTDEIQHLSVIKEFPHKVEAEEVELIKLTEIDHDFQDKASTELHAKKFFEDQEFDDAKHEEKLSKATISDVNSQDVTEITTDETVQKHNWQASEPLDQLQEPSSKECEQKIESCKTEDRDESTKTMKGQKDEKPNDSSEKTSQETCSLEEEQRELEVSNSDFIPSVVLLKPVVKDVTKDISHKPEPENESSEFQGATSASEYELNSELEMSMYSCSQESKKENECQSLEKSEQTNDISVQYESSPELISERNVVNMCEIASDIQERNEISEHIAKQYDQEWINSEDCNEDKRQKAAKTQLTMGENKSKDSEEYKDPICDTTITEVSSIDDSMKEAYKQLSEKNAFVQVNHLVQNHEILHKVTESNEMNGSNSQEALLQRDMGDDFDISTSVETQKINDRQMFPPNAVEIDILSARDAEEITDVDELERDSSDESSKETKANQFSEKLEQDDAKGENKCQDQMAILMHYQDVIETDVVARHITQANETNEKLQAPVYQNLEETNETTKPVAEIEGKTDDSLSEKQVKEICVPEKEQKELKVLNLKDEPNDDSLSKQELVEIVQTTGDSTMKEPEDLSVELEATTSTAKTETSTEPMNYSEPSSQTIKYKTKVQDLKSTEFHELTKSSQEALERKGEELAKSEKTLQEKDHQTKSNELIAEERSLNNFGAHVAATDVVNYDKIAVLSNDPTLAQQNLQETKSHDNVEKRKMGEEQEMMTEFSNSFVDDGTDAKATRHELLEHKDSEGLNEIQNVRELNILHIEEKEQEQQEKCEKLLDSSQFQDSLSNIPKEASIDDIKRLQADNKEEHNETEVYAQKGLSTIESKRIGVTSNDPAKENSERAVTVDNSSIAKNEYSEQIPENQNKAQINSITLDTTNKQQEIILQRDTNKSREDAALKPKESELKLPLISEGLREIDPKTTQKRSQNLLSGVGSKVKHSISKVKKAIACSSSQFQPEEVIVKLNKNKKN